MIRIILFGIYILVAGSVSMYMGAAHRYILLPMLLCLALLICYWQDFLLRRKLKLETHFAFVGNPLAFQGFLFLTGVVLAGWFVEPRLRLDRALDGLIYPTVVYFWASAIIGFIKYFRR